jgi:hypothetical protein
MSFKRFDQQDIVVSADSITAPAWTGNKTILTEFFLNDTQPSTPSGNYYFNLYHETSSAASTAVQFSIAYGNKLGSGSLLFDSSILDKSYSSTVYGQFRTLINGDEDTDFTFLSGSNRETKTPQHVLVISVERARFKEKILPGSLTLTLGDSATISLTDGSLISTTDTFVDAGRVYPIYSGSAGTVKDGNTEYGKLYPDVGIIILNGDILESGSYIAPLSASSNIDSRYNLTAFYDSISTGSNFSLRSEETLTSNYVFVRARNSEFNYSTNPSNITGSGELLHNIMIDSPQVYITTVGLYNDNNDLLGVAKLSTPLLKDFTKEALIRIKLDY